MHESPYCHSYNYKIRTVIEVGMRVPQSMQTRLKQVCIHTITTSFKYFLRRVLGWSINIVLTRQDHMNMWQDRNSHILIIIFQVVGVFRDVPIQTNQSDCRK